MRIGKILLCMLMIMSLCACGNEMNNKQESIDETSQVTTTTTTTTTSEPEVTQPVIPEDTFVLSKDTLDSLIDKSELELFELLNIVSFEEAKLKEFPWESDDCYYDISVFNSSLLDITLKSLSFNVAYWYTYDNPNTELSSNTRKQFVLRSDAKKIICDTLAEYSYNVTIGNIEYQMYVNLNKKVAQIRKREIRQRTTKKYEYESTYLPNNGYTIFVWNDNGEYSFDVLRGIENDGCKGNNYFFVYSSLYDVLRFDILSYYEGQTPLLVFEAYNGELDDNLKEYVSDVMTAFDNPYVFSDEQEKIEEAKSQYGTFHKLYVVRNGESDADNTECKFEYCLLNGYTNRFEFGFSDDELMTLQKGRYSLQEISKLINKNTKYNFYARGAEKELTEEEAEELLGYFNTSKYDNLYYIQIENQIIRGADKPAIYLYPEDETKIHINIESNGNLLTTYPKYNNGWNVIAYPDGTIYDLGTKRNYEYLFWEGESYTNYDMSKGFVVTKEDTVAFLQDKLTYMGLNNEEMNEFIVYWLPQLEKNAYNYITFQTEVYENTWKLNVNPTPDTMIRIFMTWYGLENPIEVEEPTLTKGERNGYTLVEWGGVEIK